MPTIEDNVRLWKRPSSWVDSGGDWSERWGSPENEWWWTIYPRMHQFVPTGTILEIAPGFGRWTNFLKDMCKKLIVVDLVEECIEACRRRFSMCDNISYHVNDGKSLSMVQDGTVDFAFSFDSLVHADRDVIRAYLSELRLKLKRDGIAFIHHSNLGRYQDNLSLRIRRAAEGKIYPRRAWLSFLEGSIIEPISWRAYDMTADKFAADAERVGLACIGQEQINWNGRKLIDCISIVTPTGSVWERPREVVENRRWLEEATSTRTLSRVYDMRASRSSNA